MHMTLLVYALTDRNCPGFSFAFKGRWQEHSGVRDWRRDAHGGRKED
jgi:hypothetical protein